MNRAEILLRKLRHCREELAAHGVESLAIIGSIARDEAVDGSDIDLVVRLSDSERGFAHFHRLDELQARLSEILNCRVDLIEEAAVPQRMRREIERDRLLAF